MLTRAPHPPFLHADLDGLDTPGELTGAADDLDDWMRDTLMSKPAVPSTGAASGAAVPQPTKSAADDDLDDFFNSL